MSRAEAQEYEVPERDGFGHNFRKNCLAIAKALTMREIYQLVIFYLVRGITQPRFDDFSYFFYLDELGISLFAFSCLILISSICSMIGAAVYKSFLRTVDTRWIVFWGVISQVAQSSAQFVQAKRWNADAGINDLVFLYCTEAVFVGLRRMLINLPLMALVAKLIPKNIEGSTFALMATADSLSWTLLQPAVGAWINHEFVGVSKNDLSNYSMLPLIQAIAAVVFLIALFLIPSKRQIRYFRYIRGKEILAVKKARRERRKAKRRARGIQSDEEKELLEG